MKGTLREHRCTFTIISPSVFLTTRNVSDKSWGENQNTYFTFNNFSGNTCRLWDMEKIKTHILRSLTFPETRAVYEIMQKNLLEPDRPQMTMWRMRIACSVIKATNTHNMQYLVLFHDNHVDTTAPQCYVYTYSACMNSLNLRPKSGMFINLWLKGQCLREYALRTGHTTSPPFIRKGGVWAPLTIIRFSVARHTPHSSWISLKHTSSNKSQHM
jgi:hypothetical protein